MERERIIYDGVDSCPYLPGQVSRMPLRYQMVQLSPSEFDTSLSFGDRRVGSMLYRTQCPSCSECEPIRVPVQHFSPSKSQRRILRKNNDIVVEMGPVRFSEERLQMYNNHKNMRGLAKNEGRSMQRSGYENWFLKTCTDTREFRYTLDGRLIGISVLDFGEQDISSVYFYFDPELSSRSLGTYSALVEILWMKRQRMRYYYLGLYVEDCRHLNYKARYYPHERLVDGRWLRFDSSKITRETAQEVSHED